MRLFLLAAFLWAAPALAQTSVYVEAIGPTSAYAVGAEHAVLASRDGGRRLSGRAGVSYWSEGFQPAGLSDLRTFAVPVEAVGSVLLGRSAKFQLAAELSVGVVFMRRNGGYTERNSDTLDLPPFTSVALRATLSDVLLVRAGVVAGGNDTTGLAGVSGRRLVVSLGIAL